MIGSRLPRFKSLVSLGLGLGSALGVSACGGSTQVVTLAPRSTEGLTSSSELIYLGDFPDVTFDDYILIQALFNLGVAEPSPAELAAEANRIFPSRAEPFLAAELDPLPTAITTDYVVAGGDSNPELEDVLVVQAAVNIPVGNRTKQNLADAVNALDPTVSLQPAEIRIIPGTDIPGPRYASSPAPESRVEVGTAPVGFPTSTFITVSEVGTAELEFTLEGLEGAEGADFSVNPAGTLTLADGAGPLQLEVICTPSAEGLRRGRLRVTTNDPTLPELAYQLRCDGIPALPAYGANFEPESRIELGSTPVGVESAPTILTISEVGFADLEVELFGLVGGNSADFSVDPFGSFVITEGDNAVDVAITCTPSRAGTRNGRLRVTTNDPDLPEFNYRLRCEGLGPAYASVPAPNTRVEVGSAEVGQSTTPINITVSEAGTEDLQFEVSGLDGAEGSDFTVSPLASPITIAEGGAPVDIQVFCTPGGVGTRRGRLRVTTNTFDLPELTYQLRCEGLPSNFP